MDREKRNAYMREWNRRNKERVNAEKKKRYILNKKRLNAAQRERYATDPEYRARIASQNKKTYETDKTPAFNRAKKWTAKDPERTRVIKRVGMNVAYAVKTGKLTKPTKCEQCGSEKRITAAHESYDRPLDVRWLCWPCHVKWDHEKPKYQVT